MIDYFSNLLGRSFGLQGDTPVVTPRIPSIFEPLREEFAETNNAATQPDDFVPETQNYKTTGRERRFSERVGVQQTAEQHLTLTKEIYDGTNFDRTTLHPVSTATAAIESPSVKAILTESEHARSFSTESIVLPQLPDNANKSLLTVHSTSGPHTHLTTADKSGSGSDSTPQKFKLDAATKNDLPVCQISENKPADKSGHLRAADSAGMRHKVVSETIELSRISIKPGPFDHEKKLLPENVVSPHGKSDALLPDTGENVPNVCSVVRQSPATNSFARPRLPITAAHSMEYDTDSIAFSLDNTKNRPSKHASASVMEEQDTSVEADSRARAFEQSKNNDATFFPVAANLIYAVTSPLSQKNCVRITGKSQSNEQTVHVTIGRIEVRALSEQETKKKSASRLKSSTGLEEYLKRRHGGGS